MEYCLKQLNRLYCGYAHVFLWFFGDAVRDSSDESDVENAKELIDACINGETLREPVKDVGLRYASDYPQVLARYSDDYTDDYVYNYDYGYDYEADSYGYGIAIRRTTTIMAMTMIMAMTTSMTMDMRTGQRTIILRVQLFFVWSIRLADFSEILHFKKRNHICCKRLLRSSIMWFTSFITGSFSCAI